MPRHGSRATGKVIFQNEAVKLSGTFDTIECVRANGLISLFNGHVNQITKLFQAVNKMELSRCI